GRRRAIRGRCRGTPRTSPPSAAGGTGRCRASCRSGLPGGSWWSPWVLRLLEVPSGACQVKKRRSIQSALGTGRFCPALVKELDTANDVSRGGGGGDQFQTPSCATGAGVARPPPRTAGRHLSSRAP